MTFFGQLLKSRKTGINDLWERNGSRVYQVAFSTDTDEVEARDYMMSIYPNNTPHPSDIGMVVVNLDIEEGDGIGIWYNPFSDADSNNNTPCFYFSMTLTYGPWNPLEHSVTGDPVNQPPDVDFDMQIFEEPADTIIDPSTGDLKACVNSAGDPFDPGVQREYVKGVMRVSFNVHHQDYQPATLLVNGNFINNDVWNNFPQYSVKWTPPKGQRLYSQFLGNVYWRLSMEFGFQLKNGFGWNADTIDAGFRELISGVAVKMTDPLGQPLSSAGLLDGSGSQLTIGGAFYVWNFQLYKDTSFNSAFATYGLNNLFV